jgi:hypothetical protein
MGAHSHSRSIDAFLHPQDMAGLTLGISVPSNEQPSPPISSIRTKGADLSGFSSFLHEQFVHEGLTHCLLGAIQTASATGIDIPETNFKNGPCKDSAFGGNYNINIPRKMLLLMHRLYTCLWR